MAIVKLFNAKDYQVPVPLKATDKLPADQAWMPPRTWDLVDGDRIDVKALPAGVTVMEPEQPAAKK
jgi:hypothetical protein